MIFRRSFVMLIAMALASVACATPTDPSVSASVRVAADSLNASRITEGAVTRLTFTVPLIVENRGTTTLRYIPCGTTVEALVDARWTPAWSPICAAAYGSETIPPGATREFVLSVSGAVDGPGAPIWSGHPGASYRVAVALLPDGLDGRIPLVTSDAFRLIGAE